jgi:hypothetical protein
MKICQFSMGFPWVFHGFSGFFPGVGVFFPCWAGDGWRLVAAGSSRWLYNLLSTGGFIPSPWFLGEYERKEGLVNNNKLYIYIYYR